MEATVDCFATLTVSVSVTDGTSLRLPESDGLSSVTDAVGKRPRFWMWGCGRLPTASVTDSEEESLMDAAPKCRRRLRQCNRTRRRNHKTLVAACCPFRKLWLRTAVRALLDIVVETTTREGPSQRLLQILVTNHSLLSKDV